MNIALILAGGIGKRIGKDVPKQFLEVNGKPVIVYTLEKFNNCTEIDKIAVVCVKDWIEELKNYAIKFGINKLEIICEGGTSGLESLKMGIDALKCNDNDYIIIHDAVRPFVTSELIRDNIALVHKRGVAMAAVDCVETLVVAEEENDGYAEIMLPRDNLKRIQTPQSFRSDILKGIFQQVNIQERTEPSIFALYMALGNPIYCSVGNERNIKITYPDDISYFERLFSDN